MEFSSSPDLVIYNIDGLVQTAVSQYLSALALHEAIDMQIIIDIQILYCISILFSFVCCSSSQVVPLTCFVSAGGTRCGSSFPEAVIANYWWCVCPNQGYIMT